MSKRLALFLATAALAAFPLAAPAAADEGLQASGSITYTWQAQPSLGCAADGLCGVQGAMVVEAQGPTAANSLGRGSVDLGFLGAQATVRVAGPDGDCVDSPGGAFAGDLIATKVHGRLLGHLEPAPSSGRCAGPRQQDLAGLALPVRRVGGKRPAYDLRTIRSFVAGPFAGRLVSTLVLRPTAGGGSTSSSSSGSFPAPAIHNVLIEQVTLRYRVATLPGTLETSFSGEPDPFCAALASCGANGTVGLSLGPFQRTMSVTAVRVVRRRVGEHEALADLRRGRLVVGYGLVGPPSVLTSTSETIQQGDGSRCQAVTTSRNAQLFVGPANPVERPGPALHVTLDDQNQAGLLRTFCPGPLDTDVFGQQQIVVAEGSLGSAQLLERHSVLSLTSQGSFAGPGYVGTRGGDLPLALTLEHVKAGTVEGPRGSVP